MKHSFSESHEILNAFVDDELDAEERQYLLNKQVTDPQLADAICELRQLKDMVRAARPNNETCDINVGLPKRHNFGSWFVAASVVLVLFSLAASTAWNTHNETVIARSMSPTYTDVTALLRAQPEQQELKMVLHITLPGHLAATRLFEQLEQVLDYSTVQRRHVQVQVIASGQGIRLLQQGQSPYQDKIRYISTHYDAVEFVACQRSMLRQAATQNTAIHILPEALITHSGHELIKRRQKQGWATIVI